MAAGILLSRCTGFLRTSLFAAYFGQVSLAGDAFNQAFRIPNILQNLFGEGALSASFVPVYASLLGAERQEEADRVARGVLALLAAVVSAFVLAGVVWTPSFIGFVAVGFHGEKLDLTIQLVRLMFPGVGLLVLSAWCLAILNSHGRFFLSYAAPVLWNAAMVVTLIVFRHRPQDRLAVVLAWGFVVGSLLQLGVQAPVVWRLLSRARGHGALHLSEHVGTVVRNFVPVAFSRGVNQLSAYIDAQISTLLPTGAVSGLFYAQQLYTLPVSLFGMSVSAAELPAMSGVVGAGTDAIATLRQRLDASQRTIAAFVVPSAVAFFALGDLIAAIIFQRGHFTHQNSLYVWAVLAGSAVGLLSSTIGRLYSAAFYALGDTRTPVKYAAVRVALVAVLGYMGAIYGPGLVHVGAEWGAVALTASAGFSGWVEFALLRRGLGRRIGTVPVPGSFLSRVWGLALVAATVATALRWAVPAGWMVSSSWLAAARSLIIVAVYGSTFLVLAHRSGVLTVTDLRRRLRRQ